MSKAQWEKYKYFKKHEFDCKHTGKNNMQHEFMILLDGIREQFDKPMKVTSGFRDYSHPIEVKKPTTGEHTLGLAADIYCVDSNARFELVELALKSGINRVGIARTFLHFGISDKHPQNVFWFYE